MERSVTMRALGAIVLAAIMAGCSPETPEGSLTLESGQQALTQSPVSAEVPWATKLGAIGGGGCSVSVLSDHWILGVGHCFAVYVGASTFPIIYSPSAGVQQYVYNGPGIALPYKPSYGPTVEADDVGLIYLSNGLGSALALTGQASIYLDARAPWCSAGSSAELTYSIAGFGMGTDVGGSPLCDASTTTEKRLQSFTLSTNDCADALVSSLTGGAHACNGDSGAAWFFRRDGRDMAFAVTSGAGYNDLYGMGEQVGTLIQPYLDWIQDTSSSIAPEHALTPTYGVTAGGWTYATFTEGFGPIFRAAGNVKQPRFNGTVTRLKDGRVLLAGGVGTASDYLATAELYDPATKTFAVTGSMSSPRELPTATLLEDGKVLVAGGVYVSSTGAYISTSAAELYDPATGTFAPTAGSMSSGRISATATRLPNGKVLVVGGMAVSANVPALTTAELYDPATRRFTPVASMSYPRYGHTATLLPSGKVLVVGGYGSGAGTPYAPRVETYDPAANTWSIGGAISRNMHTATLLENGKVLVTGGFDVALGYTATTLLYDPETAVISSGPPLSAARRYHDAVLLPNGKALIVGGWDGTSSLRTAELYDPAANGMAATVSMETPRSSPDLALLSDGTVLVTGSREAKAELFDPRPFRPTGNTNTARRAFTATELPDHTVLFVGGLTGSGGAIGSAETWDPVTGKVTPAGNLIAARYSHTATLLPSGKVLITGGYNGAPLATAELYDPATRSFSAARPMSVGRAYHTATLLPAALFPDGMVLVAGGLSGSTAVATAELYDVKRNRFAPTASLASIRRSHTATSLPDGRVLLAGGYGVGGYLATAELYDPATALFSATGSMSASRITHTATALTTSGKVLVTGGFGTAGILASAELYDPATGAFTTYDMGGPRTQHAASALPNGKVLVTGGVSAPSAYLSSALLFEPATGRFTTVGNMTAARESHQSLFHAGSQQVLLVGGTNATGMLRSAELYR